MWFDFKCPQQVHFPYTEENTEMNSHMHCDYLRGRKLPMKFLFQLLECLVCSGLRKQCRQWLTEGLLRCEGLAPHLPHPWHSQSCLHGTTPSARHPDSILPEVLSRPSPGPLSSASKENSYPELKDF